MVVIFAGSSVIPGAVHKVQSCFAVCHHLSLSVNVLHTIDPQLEIVMSIFMAGNDDEICISTENV